MWKAIGVVAVGVLSVGCGPKGPLPEKPSSNVGRCVYVNGFSQKEECREYRGDGWTQEAASLDCAGQGSKLVVGEACVYESTIGECVLGETGKYTWVVMPGSDANVCSSARRGCEFFGGGIFGPSALCGGVPPGTGGTGLPTFRWPELVCKDPLPGEPLGKGPRGQVCTWGMISGATEEGRRFEDYGSCEAVRTQRPYYGAPTATDAQRADARLEDPTYVAELDWVKSQVRATACVCCHSTLAPSGPSNWYVDQPGNFINGFYDRGLAMGAGWIDTVGFGAFPAEQNNGFLRATPATPHETIFVTTDQARMRRFFEAELVARGKTRADFADQTYGAGPLDAQRFYTPGPCANGEGVAADGTITWLNGPARYVYVLEASSSSPGVPPNLDTPAGTLFRVDAPWTAEPVSSGAMRYGEVPSGFVERVAAQSALVPGQQYYLYVLADIAIPNTRCLFTAP